MKIILSNYHYRENNSGGGNLHIGAFIRQLVKRGHSLLAKSSCSHAAVGVFPTHFFGQLRHLRSANIHYLRLQEAYPGENAARWFTPPLRRLLGSTALVWEFNTIPEQAACIGQSSKEIELTKKSFIKAAPYCDLAVCVSEAIAGYVRTELGVRQTVVIPNGGDLRPRRSFDVGDTFDVIWAGSADIQWHEFDLLFASARHLLQIPEGQKIRFHLYGPGTEKLPDPPSNVTIYGPVPHEEINAAFIRMHAGLCPYQAGPADYSSPLKFYDCLGAGLPVITTPHPQMDAVQAEMGSTELIIADRKPATFARILIELSINKARLDRHSEQARRIIETKYNWASLMDTLADRLQDLAGKTRPPTGR